VTGLVWEAKMRVVSFTGPDYWSKIELMARRPDPTGGTPQGPDPELNVEMTQASHRMKSGPNGAVPELAALAIMAALV